MHHSHAGRLLSRRPVSVQTKPLDADAGSITATDLPAGLSIDSTTGVITGTLGAYAGGTYTVTLSATDGTVKGSSQFTWTVNDTTSPSFSIANQTNDEGDKVSVTTNAQDASPGSITATDLPSGLSIDSSTGLITGTIGAYAAGTYTVTLNSTDAAGNKGSAQFTWTVNDSNPPSFTISDQTNNEGDKVSIKTNPADADAGSITAAGLPTGLSIDSSTGLITGTIGAYAAGTYTVTLNSTDVAGNKGSAQFTWNVNDSTPPNFTIANQNNNEGDTVSVKTNPVDVDAGSITATGLPNGLSIDPTTGVITGTIGAYTAGTYTVTVSATDGTVKGSSKFTWTVNDTTPPSFTIANQTNDEGDTVSVQTNPVDADAGSITAADLPGGLSIDPTTGVISGTIGTFAAGTYTVTVSSTDGALVNNTSFTWTVNDTSPPTLTNPGTQHSSPGAAVNLAINAVDVDTSVFSATGLPPGLSISPNGVMPSE
jgi:translation initiation factor IF-1